MEEVQIESRGQEEVMETHETMQDEMDREELDQVVVEWEAQEYLMQEKDWGWFVMMVMVVAVMLGGAIWLQFYSFAALVIVSAIALGIYVRRPPRTLRYQLTEEGLKEGERFYRYGDFNAFSVIQEGRNYAILLNPKQRFAPQVRVYFPQSQGEMIVDMFGARLKMTEPRLDLIDKVVRLLRI